MAKIKIQDLPKDYKISVDEMKRIRGGLLASSLASGWWPKLDDHKLTTSELRAVDLLFDKD